MSNANEFFREVQILALIKHLLDEIDKGWYVNKGRLNEIFEETKNE